MYNYNHNPGVPYPEDSGFTGCAKIQMQIRREQNEQKSKNGPGQRTSHCTH